MCGKRDKGTRDKGQGKSKFEDVKGYSDFIVFGR